MENQVDASGRSAAEFLDEMFEYEYCAECGGDQPNHTPVIFNGLWFAYCQAVVV